MGTSVVVVVLDAEAGSASVEPIAALVFAGIDFGETAGDEAAEVKASGWAVVM